MDNSVDMDTDISSSNEQVSKKQRLSPNSEAERQSNHVNEHSNTSIASNTSNYVGK